MLCETFQRLAHFRDLQSYRYIGFGSRYFSDFILIHRVLGIRNMISIEQDGTNKRWFEFNRPFNCISPYYKHSNLVLPILDWDIPTIIWLDYDGKLDETVFFDILSFCTSAQAGSIIVLSVNAEGQAYSSLKQRLNGLIEQIGEERVPSGITGKDLTKNGRLQVYRNVIDNEIREKLSERNGALSEHLQLNYQQLFNFSYEDGAQMLTVGGIIYTKDQELLLEKCSFSDFEFIRSNEEVYKIQVPHLTFREIHYLNQLLPFDGDPPDIFIPEKEVRQYAKIYRYFPTFTEAEV